MVATVGGNTGMKSSGQRRACFGNTVYKTHGWHWYGKQMNKRVPECLLDFHLDG
jgi:hypothetical protein